MFTVIYIVSVFFVILAPEADPEEDEGGSSPGQIFRTKDANFLDSFLQVFCWLQFTGRYFLIQITRHSEPLFNGTRAQSSFAEFTGSMSPEYLSLSD